MKQRRVAIIGCGRIGKMHAYAYARTPRVDVVGLADVQRARAEEMKATYGFSGAAVGEDYGAMLREQRPDLVSICLWTPLHLPVVRDVLAAGVRAVHCEKPMAPTWGEAQDLAAAARAAGAVLTFNHQRRFLPNFMKARELLASGRFGALQRMEAYNPANILDWGTHIMDLLFSFNAENPVRWVMGQIDARTTARWFSIEFEFAAEAFLRFENGVRAVVHSGDDKEINMGIRLHLEKGIIEVPAEHDLRAIEFARGQWETFTFPAVPDADRNNDAEVRAVANLLDALDSGAEPELGVARALRATEAIFAVYESARRRARIDLPLATRDSAFLSMRSAGVFGPAPAAPPPGPAAAR